MALPYRTTGSLRPTFDPARLVMSRSQAPLCLYTHCMISDHAEGTFGLLRYSLGGDRPSQTAHLTLSFIRIHGLKLEPQQHKGGISRLAPRKAGALRFIASHLSYTCIGEDPISSCSKGSRGLSVLVAGIRHLHRELQFRRAPRVETAWPSRYAIRAGRNLPDKEFRYLRTVIVTAAVYRGFDHELRARKR